MSEIDHRDLFGLLIADCELLPGYAVQVAAERLLPIAAVTSAISLHHSAMA
jgi:hypothetical protein